MLSKFIHLKETISTSIDRFKIEQTLKKYGIKNYIINDDFTVDVNGTVNLSEKKLTVLPVQFRHVSGDFFCSQNELTTLKGSPQTVGSTFNCSDNKLTSLEYAPTLVTGSFECKYNQLKNLIGAPIVKEKLNASNVINFSFDCSNNSLESLKGLPDLPYDYFNCSNNHLTSLYDCPKEVSSFFCTHNNLQSFDVLPEKVNLFLSLSNIPTKEMYRLAQIEGDFESPIEMLDPILTPELLQIATNRNDYLKDELIYSKIFFVNCVLPYLESIRLNNNISEAPESTKKLKI